MYLEDSNKEKMKANLKKIICHINNIDSKTKMDLRIKMCSYFQMYNSMKLTPRFHNIVAKFLDLLSYILSYPWIVITSLLISTFITLKPDTRSLSRKCFDLAFLGPLLATLCLIFLPFAVFGFTLWVLICSLFTCRSYSYIEFHQNIKNTMENEDRFSFATMNILLGQDVIGPDELFVI